jgi:hypothetical protein
MVHTYRVIQLLELALKAQYYSDGEIPLPDAATCNDNLGTDPDPWAQWMCIIAEDIQRDPDGDWAKNYNAANDEIKTGNYSGQHVPWYAPTRQIKTFHPRSPGMIAYRNAIIESIWEHQPSATSLSGTCHLVVNEIWTCEDSANNLYAEVSLLAPDGSSLYQTAQSTSSPGQPIDDSNPLTLDTKYGSLRITGEHTGDYIQFNAGDSSWTSNTASGPATCKLVGEDWNKDGRQNCPAPFVSRKFSCVYPCTSSGQSTSSKARRAFTFTG